MRLLVDSSVWIDYLNGKPTAQAHQLDAILDVHNILLGDLILLEILQGIRSDIEYLRLCRYFEAFELVSLLSPGLIHFAANNYRALRRRGATVRKTADSVIGSYCIRENLPLLFSDRDFEPMVEHLGLIRFRV